MPATTFSLHAHVCAMRPAVETGSQSMARGSDRRTKGLLGHPTLPLVLGAGAASLKRELPAPASVVSDKNETSLGMNLVGDLFAALGASTGVAPFITIVDRAIIQVIASSVRGVV